MEQKIEEAIKLLNENGYVVKKVSKAQMAMAGQCHHDKTKCTFNMLGIKCLDLVCIQDLIKEQVLPYFPDKEEENNE